MDLNIISWNVRGLNKQSKRASIAATIRSWKADIICLQESKLNVVDSFIISSLWHGRDIQWDYNPAIGTAGAFIFCAWSQVQDFIKYNLAGRLNTVVLKRITFEAHRTPSLTVSEKSENRQNTAT
ncbi:hypothetical protein RJ640_003115 [Escallonia rubra]|uniref:Endonuclease/exonuclease/phosphatase domain-containing protein n=1 Tax=Escallonia rubra TaxID=112253 RepID=A0AA88R4W1_9ASTE|nr:hypothetical protein RJ640_003115 [Escallonia rubra]